MIRRLFTRRWLGALLGAVVFAGVAYNLGWWQYHRHVAKVERNARLDAHLSMDPVPLGTVLTAAALPVAADWTRVSMTGRYAADPQLYVRNRATDTDNGYEVLALFETSDGARVVVDRGFVPYAADSAAVVPPTAPPPTGDVTVVGWVRPGEKASGATYPTGQIGSIALDEARAAYGGGPVLGGYVLLDTERTSAGTLAPRPARLSPPDRSLGPHFAYAYQWWLSTVVGFVLVFFGIRRELREEDPTYVPKAKKHRIWDDEDE